MKSNIYSYKNSQQLGVDGKILNMKKASKEIPTAVLYIILNDERLKDFFLIGNKARMSILTNSSSTSCTRSPRQWGRGEV